MKKLHVLIPLFVLAVSLATVNGFEVTDALGRKVSFENNPKRIVIAGRAHLMVADAAYLFPEADTRVKAFEKITQGVDNFIPLVDSRYREKRILPVGVGAEGIAAARPDLVLLKTYMRNKLGRPLEKLRIPVLYLNFESPIEYLREIEMLGTVMGNVARSREISAFYRDRLKLIDDGVSKVEKRPTVLFISYSQKGGAISFNVPPRAWLQSKLIERAGGQPVWTSAAAQQGWQKTGFEQIAVWDPDYIIVTSYFSNVDKVTRRLKEDPLWKSLKAVRKGRLLGFPADFFSWDQPDTRWILGLLWMAKQFHPEAFTTLSVPTQIRLFYREMYTIREDTYRTEIAPLLRGDME